MIAKHRCYSQSRFTKFVDMNILRPGQIEPNEFEKAILNHIAEEYPLVRSFVTNLHVLSREYTGVGCYTNFQRKAQENEPEKRYYALRKMIHIPGVPNGMGATLFCIGDDIDCLETFTFGNDHWDGRYDGFSIRDT